jgi:hypothetical protein
MRPRADLAHPVCHALRQPSDRLVADRREQRVAVGEMPVGGIGYDAHQPGRLPQQNRFRPSGPGQLQARRDEAVADRAPRPPPRRLWCHGQQTNKWTLSTKRVNVDSVH